MTTKPIVNFSIDPAELQRIENFRHQHQFPTRAAAIKWLVDWALKQNPKPPDPIGTALVEHIEAMRDRARGRKGK